MTSPLPPSRRQPRRGRCRAGTRGEDGFILMESLVAIGLIGIILAALGGFTLQTVTRTSDLRARQAATQVATSAMTLIDSIPASDLLTGRDISSAHTQFAAGSANSTVAPYMNSLVEADNRSTVVTGDGAAISTSPQTVVLNNIAFSVNTYVGTCVMVASTSNCVPSGSAGVSYRRVVVWVTWTKTGCPSTTGCTFATSTLVNADADPVFNTNRATPPATPIVVQPADQRSTVTGPVSLTLQVKSGTGVNPFTWSSTPTLPLGLTLDANGTISGTPSTTQASTAVTVTVTDAFGRSGSATFNWTVVAAPTATTPAAQATRLGAATSLNVASSCPNTACSFTMTGAPAGLSINASTGVISGTPTTVGTSSVVVTVTDAANVSASTAAFTWTITAAGPTVTSPGNQNLTVGTTASIPIPYTCPNPTCTITLTNAVPGLVLTNPAASANNSTPETASKFTAPGTVDTSGTTNLSVGKTATQSSTDFSGAPTRAVDGNTDGNYNNGSVSHTGSETQPWWQVDLGSASLIRAVKIWNRTDCCTDRLSYFYVFTSPTDMSTKTSAQLLADPTVTVERIAGLAGSPNITIPAQSAGRYVRVQLSSLGANQDHYLSLAEVQVLGATDTGSSVTVSSTSGTVYATGTVAASAVPSGTSKAYTPGLSIVDITNASDAKSAGTWTAYLAPTVASLGTRTMGTRTSPEVPVAYTCANVPCTISLAGQPSGLGLSATSGRTTANSTTSLTLAAASGTVYVNGLVNASAATNGNSTAYSPVVTLTDSGTAAVTGSGAWTVSKGLAITNPGSQAMNAGQNLSIQMAVNCPGGDCTTWTAVEQNTGTPVPISSSGLISYNNVPAGTYALRVTVTDSTNQTDTVSFTVKVVNAITVTIPNQTTNKPTSGSTVVTLNAATLVNPQADGYTYALTGQPTWLTIDPITGVMTATVTNGSTTDTSITLRVTSKASSGSVAPTTFSWTIR